MTTTDPAVPRHRRPAAATLAVVACALVAAAARVPTIGWSLTPDEAGFTLVARTWDPTAASPYGHYWVDRPPPLIALVKLTDTLGGAHALRWVAAVGCALVVLASAALAREVSRAVGGAGARDPSDRAAVLTALGVTALVSNASIDLLSAKGEVLSLSLLVGSAWLVLRAVRHRSVVPAALAGLLAGSAIGLKQNLVDGLVFAAVVLVGETVRRTLTRRDLARLGGAFLATALVPALLTLAWAGAAGVRLSALWYAIYGFRGDAFDVILAGPTGAPLRRAEHLVVLAGTTGLALLFLWFLVSSRRLFKERPVITLATGAVLVVDSVSLALGGSYWRPYLFGLVPAATLALALLTSHAPTPAGRWARSRVVTTALVALLVVSSLASGVRWVRAWPPHSGPSTGVVVGRAVGAASRPGDTLTVWGGQADVQLASGLASPYEHLWSLPARTMDHGSRQLGALLAGPQAPTWFLAWLPLDTWHDGTAASVGPVLHERYVEVARVCGGHRLYRLRTASRPDPPLTCAAIAGQRAGTAP
jgi:hypothetical protein